MKIRKYTREGTLHESTGIRPTILGRRFRLEDDPKIYVALGLKGPANDVVLQSETTEEVREMPMPEFQRVATRADE